jgi:hypothetical protein
VKREELAALGVSAEAVRDDAASITFEVPDEQAANRAARLVLERGGVLKAVLPVTETLEEVFTRLQVVSADGVAPVHAEGDPAAAVDGKVAP